MAVTIVIPYRENKEALLRTLASIKDIPVIVVDDCNDEPLKLRRKGVKVIRQDERGYFSGAVNRGLVACDTDVLVLNQDAPIVNMDWLAEWEVWRNEYGLAGDMVEKHPAFLNGYVQGTFMLMRRDAIDAVGPFDEKHYPLWGATAEWQLRAARKGYKAFPFDARLYIAHERKEGDAYGSSIRKLLAEQPEKRGLFIRIPPMVSVVVPVFNYGRYLDDLVASLEKQTMQGFELVLMDDYSTDDSWQIIKRIANPSKGYWGFRRAQNGGTAIALNEAITRAHGRYIMTVDADDMLMPECLARMAAELEQRSGKALIYSDMWLYENGERTKRWDMADYDFDKLLQQNMVPSGTMFTKLAWADAGGYPVEFGKGRQDWSFAVAMGEKGYCGYRIPEPLYIYRREGQNRSLHNNRSQFMPLMQRRFAHLYRGERPMGCCGRSTTVTLNTKSVVPTTAAMPGATGWTLLEYISPADGRYTVVGAVTGKTYSVKPSNPKIWVANEDVPAMLEIIEDRRYIFVVASPDVKVESA